MNKNIELRWVWHDFSKGGPPCGSICIGGGNGSRGMFQKLQYREKYETADEFGPWYDVCHSGEDA